jgi:hypothetical protein
MLINDKPVIQVIHEVLHVPPQEEVAQKFSGLEEHTRTIHHTQHNTYVFTIRK